MKGAYKLLSRDKVTFEGLTPSEQKLWNSFKTDLIYRLLTGEPDTVPEFRFNWYTVTGGDATAKFISARSSVQSQPITALANVVQLPAPVLAIITQTKALRASTSAQGPPPMTSSGTPASTTHSSQHHLPPVRFQNLQHLRQPQVPPLLQLDLQRRQYQHQDLRSQPDIWDLPRTLIVENFTLGNNCYLVKENFSKVAALPASL